MKKRFLILISLALLVLITLCSCEVIGTQGADSSEASTDETQTESNTAADTTPENNDDNNDGNENSGEQPQTPTENGTAATFAELKAHVIGRTKNITITADIIINETLYVTDDITITATENHTLTRDPAFAGDIFVIGEDAEEENPIILDRLAILTLKPAEGVTLTVDGNSANTTVTVAGSAFFLTNSAKLNVYDGVAIVNHTKLGNARLSESNPYFLDYPLKAGGAAVLITDGAFNMYGGTVSNCHVNNKDEKTVATEEQSAGFDNSSCGGAVYSHGTFNMYGGTISNCSAARGGAVYDYRIVNIYGGTLDSNSAAVYGGGVYMANSQYTNSVIGNDGTGNAVLFSQNSCKNSGGAIYMSHQSTIHVMGNATFKGNTAGSNGGAINAAGELIVTYATFTENSADSKGGAIYAYYSKREFSPRVVRIDGGLFEKNSADRGGAICFADSGDVTRGAIGKIGTVSFTENKAVETDGYGNGGALYLTGKSTVTFTGSPTFAKNSAASGGGAIFVTGASTVDFSSNDITLTFTECSATKNGGAIYAYTDTVLTLPKLVFTDNTAGGNAGAMYVSQSAEVTVYGASAFDGNTAKKGGAIYATSSGIDEGADSTSLIFNGVATFKNNQASEEGGAIYLTSQGLLTFNASSEFTSNSSTAKTGGAIYVVSEGTVLKFNATSTFSKNSANTKGGAIYATTGSTTVFNANVTFTENTAKEDGGAFYITKATVKHDAGYETVKLSFMSNTADKGGGALFITESSNVTLGNLEFISNSAKQNGGAMYVYTVKDEDLTENTVPTSVNIGTITATGNCSTGTKYYGGFLYISGIARMTVGNVTATNNTAPKGGAIYITTTDTSLTINGGSFSGNTATATESGYDNCGHSIWSNSSKAKLYIKTASVTFPTGTVQGKGTYTEIQ